MLAFPPLEDETLKSAVEHEKFLSFVLETFGKDWDNIFSLCGDNTKVNQSLSTIRGIPFLGFHSHRFNFLLKDLLADHEPPIEKFNQIMAKLKYGIASAKLRKASNLVARTRNQTRWSSTFSMLKRHCEIREHLDKLDIDDLDDLLLSKKKMKRWIYYFPLYKIWSQSKKSCKRIQKRWQTHEHFSILS